MTETDEFGHFSIPMSDPKRRDAIRRELGIVDDEDEKAKVRPTSVLPQKISREDLLEYRCFAQAIELLTLKHEKELKDAATKFDAFKAELRVRYILTEESTFDSVDGTIKR